MRVLGLLDLGNVEQLPSEEGHRMVHIPAPRGLLKLSLGVLQDKELLRLGPGAPNHAYSVVAHLQHARGDIVHGIFKSVDGFRGAQVYKSRLPGGELVLALQYADAPSLREGGLGFGDQPIVLGWVMIQGHPKLGQRAHPKATVDEEPFGNKISAEGQPCLHLVAVQSGDLVHRNLAREGALDLQQDQGLVQGLEVTIGAASYFAVERVSLGKIEGDCVTKHLGAVLPLNIGSSEWLEELAPSTSHVFAQI